METQQQPLFESKRGHPQSRHPMPAPVWLQRMSLIMLVLFCLYIGLILAILPWSPRLWDHNGWLLSHPTAFAVLRQGWARGLISGLGLIDVWIGVSEALHYRDPRIPKRHSQPRSRSPESTDDR